MKAAVMHAPGDVRVEERADPQIVEPTDAIIRVSAACVCGSDLWPYRGIEEYEWPAPMGHEYAGIVEGVGDEVETIKPGQFGVGRSGPATTPARSAGPATRAPDMRPWIRGDRSRPCFARDAQTA
jgi:threonine dehydrogenase-like Zn-dependent dehydrogenase